MAQGFKEKTLSVERLVAENIRVLEDIEVVGAIRVTGGQDVTGDLDVTGDVSITGAVLAAGGDSNNPGIGWSADADGSGTGLYRFAADWIAFTNGGVVGVAISGNADLRIGTQIIFGSGINSEVDAVLTRDSAGGTLALKHGTASNPTAMRFYGGNLGYLQVKAVSELTAIAAAAFTDTTIQTPANSLILGVTVRVTVVIPTAATFDVGVAGATTRYGTGIAVAANTTNTSPGTTNPSLYSAATSIRITPNLQPADNSGRVRVTVHYIDLVAATS